MADAKSGIETIAGRPVSPPPQETINQWIAEGRTVFVGPGHQLPPLPSDEFSYEVRLVRVEHGR